MTAWDEFNADCENPDFFAEAACKGLDSDLFYPHPTDSHDEALAICKGCPVREKCLRYAFDNDEIHGIWGGMTEQQRKAITGSKNESLLAAEKRRRLKKLAAMPRLCSRGPLAVAEAFGITDRTANRDLSELREKGLIA
jgi:hypothetical protein